MTYDEEKKVADVIVALTERIGALESDNDRLLTLTSDLRLQAQTHAMEARGANSTIAEIYQIISGGKGEPGNWRGAQPVREYVEAAKVEILRLETVLALSKPVYSRRQIEARVKLLREALEFYATKTHWEDGKFIQGEEPNVIRAIMSTIDSDNGKVARAALASTGGEHHAE